MKALTTMAMAMMSARTILWPLGLVLLTWAILHVADRVLRARVELARRRALARAAATRPLTVSDFDGDPYRDPYRTRDLAN